MRSFNRSRYVVALAVVSLVIGGASLAWACTRTPGISLTPSFGKAGSQTTVVGRAFSAGEPVEIRWNSTSGPLLGRATGPSFSVLVTVPSEVAGGVYYIVADAPTSRSQNAFQIRTPAQADDPAPTDDPQTTANANGADGTQGTGGLTSTSASGGTDTGAASPEQTGTLSFAEPSAGEVADAQPVTQPAPASTRVSNTAASKAPAASASANPAVVATPAGRPVFGGSTSSPIAATATQAAGLPDDEQARVAAGSASGDLWSGFSSSGRASMVPRPVDPTTSQGPGSELAVGIALLGGGLVALMSGVGVAEIRRKRVLAGSTSP